MIQTGFNKEQIINRLRFDNVWWRSNSIDEYFDKMFHRLYLSKFYSLLVDNSIRRGLILMGPRRVGKTVMIYHSIKRLIAEGVNPRKIVYISVETPIYNRISLEELFRLSCEAVGNDSDTDGYYVFFDEIQYLKNWEVHFKSLIDTYRNTKFIASGSAAAALKMKSIESGAGRFTDFYLPPLLFCEYLHLMNLNHLIIPSDIEINEGLHIKHGTIDINELNNHFIDYLNFGGYPEVVLSERIRGNPGQFIRHDIIDKVLLRDLPSIYGISDVQELNSFFSVIAYHSGNEFSFEKLSKISGVRKETLRKYIEYLEAAFLIKLLNKVDINAKHFQRINTFKIYLTNPSLRSALFEPLQSTDDNIGSMVETAVFSQLFPRGDNLLRYANWKLGRSQGEVDIVRLNAANQKPLSVTEIKWSNRYYENINELKSLMSFMENNNLSTGTVTTINKQGVAEYNKRTLHFLPTSILVYNLGADTLNTYL